MYNFLSVEGRSFVVPPVGPAIQSENISPVMSFETETPVALACWNDRPYATLRASHRYLVADFLLTLLLHLYAALVSRAARAPSLWFGSRGVFKSVE
jgi:cytochrome b561